MKVYLWSLAVALGVVVGFAGGRWLAAPPGAAGSVARVEPAAGGRPAPAGNPGPSRVDSRPGSVRAWVETIEGLDPAGYQSLLDQTLREPGRFGSYPSLQVQLLLRAWAEADPRAALRYLLSMQGDERYAALPGMLLSFWAADDAESAVEAFIALPPAAGKGAILLGMIPAMVQSAPTLAIRLVDQMEPGREGTAAMILLASLIQVDADLAVSWINQMEEGEARNRMLGQYYQHLSREDPRQAAAMALRQLTGRPRSEQLGRIIGEWGRSSFAEALAFVHSLDDAGLRLEANDHLARAAAAGALPPEEAIAWITANASGRAMAGAVQMVIRDVAQADPARAARLLAELPLGRSYQSGLATLASAWGASDPAAAYRWMEEIPPGAERQRAFAAFSRSFAEANPERAIRFLAEVDSPAERATLVRDVAAQIANDDPAAALNWSDAIVDADLRQEAQRSIILAWAEQDPLAVGAYVLQRPDLNLTASEYRRIGSAYASRDPVGAGQWLLALPEDVQSRTVDTVVREWVGTDAYAASAWVSGLSDGPLRETAVENLVRMVMRYEPDSALEWALTLQDEGSRSRLTMQAASVWGMTDPQSAMAAVQATRLPPEEKERLISAIQSGEGAFPGRGGWGGRWR